MLQNHRNTIRFLTVTQWTKNRIPLRAGLLSRTPRDALTSSSSCSIVHLWPVWSSGHSICMDSRKTTVQILVGPSVRSMCAIGLLSWADTAAVLKVPLNTDQLASPLSLPRQRLDRQAHVAPVSYSLHERSSRAWRRNDRYTFYTVQWILNTAHMLLYIYTHVCPLYEELYT